MLKCCCLFQGMFDKPNTAGFIHVSHYLLSVYDEERFKKLVEWPILEKKSEGKYRNEVRDFITAISHENPDIGFPSILASHLFHAGGNKFINIMSKLSQAVLKVFLKRQMPDTMIYDSPRAGPCDELSKKLLNNIIADDSEKILTAHLRIQEIEEKASKISQNLAEAIEKNRVETFELKEELSTIAANATVHPDVKKRIADPNDSEIIQLWKNNIHDGLAYVRKSMKKLKKITEKSEQVARMVDSILSSDTNCLDACNIPKIEYEFFLEQPGLQPELQVALHHLYDGNQLDLSNFMIVFNSVLEMIQIYLLKNKLPDFTNCNLQIEASTSDLKSMCKLMENIEIAVGNLIAELKSDDNVPKNYHNLSMHLTQEVFDTVILKSSPTINFNSNGYDAEKNEALKRLELTPVEGVHKDLFNRYKNYENPYTPKAPKPRPKIQITRINFDNTMSSINDRFSPVKRLGPPAFVGQGTTGKTAKFSRLFAGNNRTTNLANCSIASTGSWKMSTLVDNSFNMSMRDLTAPPNNSTPERISSRSVNHTINPLDKPEFNSTEIVNELGTINENTEIKISMGVSPRPKTDKPLSDEKKHRRRSISDLVERFRRIREISSTGFIENSNDNITTDEVFGS